MRLYLVRHGEAMPESEDPERFEEMKDRYYTLQGWDVKTGLPTPEKLAALGLDDVEAAMKAQRGGD